MNVLLDTNAYSAILRGDPRSQIASGSPNRFLTSAVVAGELLFGFRNGSRCARNMRQLEAFL